MSAMTDIDFPKWLEKQRTDRDWSQSELSRVAGVSRQVISDYEGYKRKYFDEDILNKLARAFKLPPELVFRAAGLMDPAIESDTWVEEMNHKIKLLSPSARPMAERLLNALLEEAQPSTKKAKSRA